MSSAYRDGLLAWSHATPNSENPYPSAIGENQQRIDWFSGWYDAKFHEKYPPWPGVE